MDDIFFYILVIIIIIIIIIVLYNYSKNIEKFNDIEFLNCHIFKKNGDIQGDFPLQCRDNIKIDKFKNEVSLPDNKGLTGENGKIFSIISHVNNERKCSNCNPINEEKKNKIEGINNGTRNLTISPNINMFNTINTSKITFNKFGNPLIIDNSNISILKELTNSYKKCGDNKYNNSASIFSSTSSTSIGECIECTICPVGKYSTCGNDSREGKCIECITCEEGQYLKGCEGKQEGTCMPNICTCDNGTGGTGADCNEDGKEHCISCNEHYQLIDNTCSPCNETKPPYSSYNSNSCLWQCEENYTTNHDGNECLILCDDGYKRNLTQNTCVPCGIDHYKEGENTYTECTPCDVRGTTHENDTATSEESCVPKVGYRKDGTDNFTLLPGHRESETPGTILGCEFNYKRNSERSECTECPTLSNGNYHDTILNNDCSNIICNERYKLNANNNNCILKSCNENEYLDPKGDCINVKEKYGDGIGLLNGDLILSQNYSWNDSRSRSCPLGKKRDGEHRITLDKFYENINCTSCQSIEGNKEYIDGYDPGNNCMWDCKYGYEEDDGTCLKVCDPGYKRADNTCVPCGIDHYKSEPNTNTTCSQCHIHPKHTTNDNTTARNISECLIECGEGKYRDENLNTCVDCPENTYKIETNTSTTCTTCLDRYTTNGEIGQTSCTLAPQLECSSVNQYYDETYCPENSNYDDSGNCICNSGYEVNSANDGCEVSSPTMKIVGERCSSDDECYSGICKEKNRFYLQKVCKGRAYGEQCMSAKQQCRSLHHCQNNSCGPVKRGGSCNNGEECEQGTTCRYHSYEHEKICS